MNRKRELVENIAKRLRKANVRLGELALCVEGDEFWEKFPDGHFCSQLFPSLEGKLSCLDEHSLEKILNNPDTIIEGADFDTVWDLWGEKQYFQTVPSVLHLGDAPKLRIRHDSYIHFMEGSGCQNSHDGYSNCYDGESFLDLNLVRKILTPPPIESGDASYLERVNMRWNTRYNYFRKGMLYSYPCQAIGNHKAFHRMLDTYPAVFDYFMNGSDKAELGIGVDTDIGVEGFIDHCSKVQFVGDILAIFPVKSATEKSHGWNFSRVKAVLYPGNTSVMVCWKTIDGEQSLCLNFPEWSDAGYRLDRDRHCGCTVDYMEENLYLYLCWFHLSIALLTFAGFKVGQYFTRNPTGKISYRGFDSALLLTDASITGLRTLSSLLLKASRYHPCGSDGNIAYA